MGLSHTMSGDIASFRTPSRVPIESLKFHFLPKQADGTPSPENPIPIEGWTGLNGGRAGKNLLDTSTRAMADHYELNGIAFDYNSDGTLTVNGSVSQDASAGPQYRIAVWEQQFTGNYYICVDAPYTTAYNEVFVYDSTLSERPRKWDGVTTSQSAGSNRPLSEVQLIAGHTYSYNIRITRETEKEYHDDIFYPMLLPSWCTDTTFEPYSGEQIPIIFPSNGKNLYDKNTLGIELQTHNLRLARNSGRGNPFLLRKGFTYTFSCNSATTPNEIRIMIPYTADTIVYTYSSYITYTPSEDIYVGINFYWTNGRPEDATDFQIELGSAKTEYTPYSSDNTFYGGYYDPVAGEIVAEYYLAKAKKNDFGNKSTPGGTGRDYRQTQSIFPKTDSGVAWAVARQQQKFNRGIIANPWSEGSYGENIGIIATQDSVNPAITYMRISEEVYQAMNDDDYAEISYKLREPIHIPIPAEDIQAFLDHNNFWSDANDITEVTYAVTESKDILATRKKAMEFDIGHHKKVKWNQLVKDGNYTGDLVDGSRWIAANSTCGELNIADGIATWTCTVAPTAYYQTGTTWGRGTNYNYLLIPQDHKVLVSAKMRCSLPVQARIYGLVGGGANVYKYSQRIEENTWTDVTGFIQDRPETPQSAEDDLIIKRFRTCITGISNISEIVAGTIFEVKNLMAFDLTQMFGAGNEPTTVEEFEHICAINGIDLATYQPYNEGSDRWLIIP